MIVILLIIIFAFAFLFIVGTLTPLVYGYTENRNRRGTPLWERYIDYIESIGVKLAERRNRRDGYEEWRDEE